jgi:hypothetical protein
MNAVDWVKNAVFAALMEETNELTDAVAPAMPATPGLIIGGDMRSPVAVHCARAVGIQGSSASAANAIGLTPSRDSAPFALSITTPRCPYSEKSAATCPARTLGAFQTHKKT